MSSISECGDDGGVADQIVDIDTLLESCAVSEDCQRFDDMLLAILQKDQKIDKFLDRIFNFLCRRTDFFLVQDSPNLPYGFPPNSSKQTVQKLFNKYDSIPKDKLKQRLMDTNDQLKKTPQSTSKKSETKPKHENKNDEKLKDVNLDLKTKQDLFQCDPSSYNGAKRDNYSWTQSIKDIDVRVNIGPEIKSSKDLRVKIEKEKLSVSVKEATLIDDKLAWKIKPDECTWSLFPGDHIHIYLEKQQERWWEKLLENEEKLDLKNMNPEKPMHELDETSQAKIQQMMFDEQQKRLGLPTSEEQKRLDMLKQAWDADGSPFKGQPFDPSVLKMN